MGKIASNTFDGSRGQVAIEPATLAIALPSDAEALHRPETIRNGIEILFVENKFAHTVYVILPYGV